MNKTFLLHLVPAKLRIEFTGNIVTMEHTNWHTEYFTVPYFFVQPTSRVRLVAVSRSKELITPRHILEMLSKDFDEPSDSSTPLSVEDRRFIQLLDEQTVVDDDGHYSMPLPLRPNIADLPKNRHVSMKRLLGLCGRFRKDQAYREEYTVFMQ